MTTTIQAASNSEALNPASNELRKAPTGIPGLDQVTNGGLPRGRPTLICGGAGCGKTLMATEFLVRGIMEFDEPGVFIAFEETPDEIAKNVTSLGFDLPSLIDQNKLALDYIHIDRAEINETGEYDLQGLFIRIEAAIESVGAKRIVIDTIETLFAGLDNASVLRAELLRLFRWLKDRGLTAIVTGERGDGQLTRQGMEEYVSDCVILLDHRVNDQLSTRRLRIVKYRGSTHGTNEYPFIIQENGISVLPVTSVGLNHAATDERVSTGIHRLDTMLDGKGVYRGSSILISGAAGTGKTSFASQFVQAACERGERCLYFAFEESEQQIVRNMRSIGLNLDKWIEKGLLKIHASRPTLSGLEAHLVTMHKAVNTFQPQNVVLDPLSNFTSVGSASEASSLLMRLIDFLKSEQITGFFTDLSAASGFETTDIGISSIIDTWILLKNMEASGERNRALYILKSRGMPHSNQLREVRLTNHGVELVDVYLGSEGVLTGTLRANQEAREKAAKLTAIQDSERRQMALETKRKAIEAQIDLLRIESEALLNEAQLVRAQADAQDAIAVANRREMSMRRGKDLDNGGVRPTGRDL